MFCGSEKQWICGQVFWMADEAEVMGICGEKVVDREKVEYNR